MPFTIRRPRHRRLRLAFWGNFGSLNLGNECTLAAVLNNLRRRAANDELLCICTVPADAAVRHGLSAVPLRAVHAPELRAGWSGLRRRLFWVWDELTAWVSAAKVAWRQDAVLVAGTGVLTDVGEGTLGMPYELFKWALLTKLGGGKVVFLSVGVEPIARPLARFFIGAALRLADYRSYRDEHSRALIGSMRLTALPESVYPDLAFSLPTDLTVPVALQSMSSPTVAVGLFNYRGVSGEDIQAYAAYLDWLRRFIQWLLARGHAVRVIIGDFAYDETVRLDLRRILEDQGICLERYLDTPARSFEEVLGQIASVDLVVASRFHNVLLSLLLGRPVLSVSYDPKNDALMRSMGLEAFCQQLGAVDYDRLTGQFLDLAHNASVLRNAILSRSADFRAQLERQYDQILKPAAATGGAADPEQSPHGQT